MVFSIEERHGAPISSSDELKDFMKWCDEVAGQDPKKVKKLIIKKKGVPYWNIPCSFDIETTSYEDSAGKHGTMYAYVFGVFGRVFVGRTWADFMAMYAYAVKAFKTHERRLTIYVHNLSYEFQFIRKRICWRQIFALDEREVCYALSQDGVIFRCSYILSGYSLAKVGEHLMKYKVKKRVGDLDYTLRRGCTTPLTDKEWGYIYNDGLVVRAYIQEEIESNSGKITKIPNTKTGYVRRYRRDMCMNGENGSHHNTGYKYSGYRRRMSRQTLEVDEYNRARLAFAGGYTHANLFNVREEWDDVQSMDFTSSYPAVMVMEKFPCTKGRLYPLCSEEELKILSKDNLLIFGVLFHNLRSKFVGDHYLSVSKCSEIVNPRTDNGRIRSCESAEAVRTSIDFEVMKQCYDWDSVEFGCCYLYGMSYLPTDFVKGVVGLYRKKTTLKGVEGMEAEYRSSKENLNSCYGRCVTDISRDEIVYGDEGWSTRPKDIVKDIDHYNKSKGRFLSYLWGVFVTAYARRNLWTAIVSLGRDYIYSDTDSVKYINPEEHQTYFEQYNKNVEKKLREACRYHGIPFDHVAPKTVKGAVKRLGLWDDDGRYKRFKTLGAKRYMVEKQDGSISITISGVSKKEGVDFLKHKYRSNDNIFRHFDTDLIFPSVYTDHGTVKQGSGKQTHSYIDYKDSGEFVDYLGTMQKWTELSSIHLEPASYSLSLLSDYIMRMNLIHATR